MKKYIWFGFMLLFFSCKEKEEMPYVSPNTLGLMEIPEGFPSVDFPDGNEYTQARWALGKKLFYDVSMSVDSSISCGTCHKQDLAFSDDVAFSLGVENRPGTRNAPTLANVAYHPYFTREGGVATLEQQILVPIQEHNEFDFNIVLLAERLGQDSLYVKMAADAYDRTPDPFVITRALACFERSLLSGQSRYDSYTFLDENDAISEEEKQGMDLFFSEKAQCGTCHSGFNFTNYTFENNGLYTVYADEGRFRLTGEEVDRALFKVPSLRNIELTAPYMHDGSLPSLEAVIEHYSEDVKAHPNKNPLVKSLNLTESEKTGLVAFLKTLTDDNFVKNPLFR